MKKISKLSYLKDLVKTANDLDRKGLYKEADVIDGVIMKMANPGMLGAPVERGLNPQDGGGRVDVTANVAQATVTFGRDYMNISMVYDNASSTAMVADVKLFYNDCGLYFGNQKQSPGKLQTIYEQIRLARSVLDMSGADVRQDTLGAIRGCMEQQAPSGSVTTPVAKTAPKPSTPVISRNNRDYIFLDDDFKYAYQFGDKPGTYKAFAVSNGKFLGVFEDRPGFEKVKAAAIKKGLEPVDMGEKPEGELDFDSLLS